VATRNFEVDSGAYFISLLYNYLRTPGLFAPERLLNETVVHDAVAATIRTWKIEQNHEHQSPYRWVAGWGWKRAAAGGLWPVAPAQLQACAVWPPACSSSVRPLDPPRRPALRCMRAFSQSKAAAASALAPGSARRYSELPREGLGPVTRYTGMIWGGYRPSDDPQVRAAGGGRRLGMLAGRRSNLRVEWCRAVPLT
jgi:hypothetical protein